MRLSTTHAIAIALAYAGLASLVAYEIYGVRMIFLPPLGFTLIALGFLVMLVVVIPGMWRTLKR